MGALIAGRARKECFAYAFAAIGLDRARYALSGDAELVGTSPKVSVLSVGLPAVAAAASLL